MKEEITNKEYPPMALTNHNNAALLIDKTMCGKERRRKKRKAERNKQKN